MNEPPFHPDTIPISNNEESSPLPSVPNPIAIPSEEFINNDNSPSINDPNAFPMQLGAQSQDSTAVPITIPELDASGEISYPIRMNGTSTHAVVANHTTSNGAARRVPLNGLIDSKVFTI